MFLASWVPSDRGSPSLPGDHQLKLPGSKLPLLAAEPTSFYAWSVGAWDSHAHPGAAKTLSKQPVPLLPANRQVSQSPDGPVGKPVQLFLLNQFEGLDQKVCISSLPGKVSPQRYHSGTGQRLAAERALDSQSGSGVPTPGLPLTSHMFLSKECHL